MSVIQLVFLFAAAVVLASALMVVTTRRMFHAALWLIVTLFGVAIIFALLQAGFFVVVQILVYVGAIAILVIFATMLTRNVMEDRGPQTVAWWPLAALVAVAVLGGLILLLSGLTGWSQSLSELPAADANALVSRLGLALVAPDQFALPFEVASVLLLAALIGAIYLAWDRPAGGER